MASKVWEKGCKKVKHNIADNEEMRAEHAWLVFLYGLDLVTNIMHHLDHKKDTAINVPPRYRVVYHDCVEYYNRWCGVVK